MADIEVVLNTISHFCDENQCFKCPMRFEKPSRYGKVLTCNFTELFELLAGDDPCYWDMERIKEVLDRECRG